MAATAPHAAAAAGRRRLGQDGGRADGDGDRRGSRSAGRLDGADRSARPPASSKPSRRSPRRPACASRCSRGAKKAKPATPCSSRLATGEIDILIGTHALFQADVQFKDLAVAVIDEQHRFGVHQRMALQSKGSNGGTNVLVMTATPIPRTLLMTHYGDLDVSRAHRKARRPQTRRHQGRTRSTCWRRLIDRVRAQLGRGRAGLLGLPADRELRDFRSRRRRRALRISAPDLRRDSVGLLHGGMARQGEGRDDGGFRRRPAENSRRDDRDRSRRQRSQRQHHGDRARRALRLAQLHQLRGRVGRGDRQSYLHAALQSAARRDRARRD